MACRKVEELFNQLYLEYSQFCKMNSIQVTIFHVKRIEEVDEKNQSFGENQ